MGEENNIQSLHLGKSTKTTMWGEKYRVQFKTQTKVIKYYQ